jgi:sn-1 stearoyl-lipid 9-desaturase
MLSDRPNWLTGLALLGIHIAALLALLPQFFSWQAVVAAAVIAYVTGALGVTLNFHRTLTHRSLRMVMPLEYLTALFGTLSFQGGPIDWVATHRVHHANSDQQGDPHTVRRGLSWAHITWLLRQNRWVPSEPDYKRYAPDLWDQPYYRFLQYAHLPLQIALAGALFAIGGWSWVIWGVFVRLVFTYHTTWLVNSAAHYAGYRTYRTTDRSTNSWWVALLSFGEGWHNNHHAFPFSARHGIARHEIDLTWWTIKVLRFMRLADKVRVPTAAMLARFKIV